MLHLPVILASSSPFRSQLLTQAGIPFTSLNPSVDEKQILARDPSKLASLRAIAKATKVAEQQPNAIVIGCDQVLEFSKRPWDKVESADAAFQRLTEFSGATHYLRSAVCIIHPTHGSFSFVETAELTMRQLSADEIHGYVATNEWQGCVGCYRIEGQGINLFANIHGDWSTIIGLPLPPLLNTLRSWGINPLLNRSTSVTNGS